LTLYETIYQQIGWVMDASQFFLVSAASESDGVSPVLPAGRGDLLLDQVMPAGPSDRHTFMLPASHPPPHHR